MIAEDEQTVQPLTFKVFCPEMAGIACYQGAKHETRAGVLAKTDWPAQKVTAYCAQRNVLYDEASIGR